MLFSLALYPPNDNGIAGGRYEAVAVGPQGAHQVTQAVAPDRQDTATCVNLTNIDISI